MPEYYSHKLRLRPTQDQIAPFYQYSGARRYAYNWALSLIKENQDLWRQQTDANLPKEERTQPLSAWTLGKMWTQYKADVPWTQEYNWSVFESAIKDVVKAHKAWMKGSGFPDYKAKHFTTPAFRLRNSNRTIKLEHQRVKLPSLGYVKLASWDKRCTALVKSITKGDTKILSTTITRDKVGDWWVSINVQDLTYTKSDPAVPSSIIGIDLGVKTLFTVADTKSEVTTLLDQRQGRVGETKQETAARLTKRQQRLQKRILRLQRKQSRQDLEYSKIEGLDHPRKSPSKNREKTRVALAKAKRQQVFTRTTSLHQSTSQLASLGVAIALEDLNVKGMTASVKKNKDGVKKGKKAKAGLNRRILEQCFGEVRRQLTYKLPPDYLIMVDRWYPSSKTCSVCLSENQTLTLKDRVWTCSNCNTVHDRDVNAAINLAKWGQRYLTLNTTWDLVGPGQLGDRDLQDHQGEYEPVRRDLIPQVTEVVNGNKQLNPSSDTGV